MPDLADTFAGTGGVDNHQTAEITRRVEALYKRGRIKLFYKLGIWRRKRAQILERDNHECQKCKAEGRQSKATCVHHIKHLDQRPDLALVDSNLISRCDACHNQEHPEKLKKYQVNRKEYITPERW